MLRPRDPQVMVLYGAQHMSRFQEFRTWQFRLPGWFGRSRQRLLWRLWIFSWTHRWERSLRDQHGQGCSSVPGLVHVQPWQVPHIPSLEITGHGHMESKPLRNGSWSQALGWVPAAPIGPSQAIAD